MSKPFPAGCEIGGYEDTHMIRGGIIRTHWWCIFDYDAGTWLCNYVHDETTTDIQGAGETPRAAMEQLVNRWTLLNGGVESPTLRALLPRMRLLFAEDGSIDPADIVVKE